MEPKKVHILQIEAGFGVVEPFDLFLSLWKFRKHVGLVYSFQLFHQQRPAMEWNQETCIIKLTSTTDKESLPINKKNNGLLTCKTTLPKRITK